MNESLRDKKKRKITIIINEYQNGENVSLEILKASLKLKSCNFFEMHAKIILIGSYSLILN